MVGCVSLFFRCRLIYDFFIFYKYVACQSLKINSKIISAIPVRYRNEFPHHHVVPLDWITLIFGVWLGLESHHFEGVVLELAHVDSLPSFHQILVFVVIINHLLLQANFSSLFLLAHNKEH